jgi:hypothetical protein
MAGCHNCACKLNFQIESNQDVPIPDVVRSGARHTLLVTKSSTSKSCGHAMSMAVVLIPQAALLSTDSCDPLIYCVGRMIRGEIR